MTEVWRNGTNWHLNLFLEQAGKEEGPNTSTPANLATHPPPQAAHQPGNEEVWTPARPVQSLHSQILQAVQFWPQFWPRQFAPRLCRYFRWLHWENRIIRLAEWNKAVWPHPEIFLANFSNWVRPHKLGSAGPSVNASSFPTRQPCKREMVSLDELQHPSARVKRLREIE